MDIKKIKLVPSFGCSPDLGDENAEIIPGISLGGIKLGENISQYQNEINCDHFFHSGKRIKTTSVSPMIISYMVRAKGIEVIVYIPSGEIIALIAHPLYQGKLFGDIGIGNTTHSLKKKIPGIAIENRVLKSAKIGGIEFGCPENFDEIEELDLIDFPEFNLFHIEIFNTEFH